MQLFQTPSRHFFDLPNTVKAVQIQFDLFPSLVLTFPAGDLVAGWQVGQWAAGSLKFMLPQPNLGWDWDEHGKV